MTLKLAQKYIEMGFPVIPVPAGQKNPDIAGWQNLKVTKENCSKYFHNGKQNIAIQLGIEKSPYIDLDIDSNDAAYFAKHFAPPTEYIYGRLSNPESHYLYQLKLSEATPFKFQDPNGDMILEIRGKNQLSILPGSIHPCGEEYLLNNVEGHPTNVSYLCLSNAAKLIAVCSLLARNYPSQGSRHEFALHLSGTLCKAGYTEEQVKEAVYRIAKFSGDEEATERRQTAVGTYKKYVQGAEISGISGLTKILPEEILKKIKTWLNLTNSQLADDAIEELNKNYAFILVGGKQRIMRKCHNYLIDSEDIEFIDIDAFRGLLKNKFIILQQDGKAVKQPISEVWLSHKNRKTYEQIVFEPGKKLPENIYNEWKGFAIQPVDDESKCEKILTHIHMVICGGNDNDFLWLISWLAQMVQNPANKPGTSVILIGPPGAGKSVFGEYIGKLFGVNYKNISKASQVVGSFNAHLAKVVFLQCEEACFAGNKSTESILKDMITSNSMMIERKGLDAIQGRNCLHVLITANDENVISIEENDRRYFILEVSDTYVGNEEYFNDLWDEMNNGGPSSLLNVLLNFDYKDVNLKKAPTTQALIKQKIISFPDEIKKLYEILQSGQIFPQGKDWPTYIETEFLFNLCTDNQGKDDFKSNQTSFGMNLRNYLGDITKSKKTVLAKNSITGEPIMNDLGEYQKNHVMVYNLPSLEECRKRFSNKTGVTFKVSDEGDL